VQENLAEAKRRIEKARRTQAESLDLGDLALSELPASLGDLPNLKVLYLGTASPTKVGWRDSPEFTDLTPLAGLHSLHSLNLVDCKKCHGPETAGATPRTSNP
jgi:hypothetical protein